MIRTVTRYKDRRTSSFVKNMLGLRDAHLEKLYAAFRKETKVPAERIELVQDLNLKGEIIFYFRDKAPELAEEIVYEPQWINHEGALQKLEEELAAGSDEESVSLQWLIDKHQFHSDIKSRWICQLAEFIKPASAAASDQKGLDLL